MHLRATWLLSLLICAILVAAQGGSSWQTKQVTIHDKAPEVKGDLKIKVDHSNLKQSTSTKAGGHLWVLSSHLTFDQNIADKITHGQLVQLAADALGEVGPAMDLYGANEEGGPPSAMTAMAVGNEIYLSSSYKGKGAFYKRFLKSPVNEILSECVASFENSRRDVPKEDESNSNSKYHYMNGHCGEIMVMHQYLRKHKKEDEKLQKLSDKPKAVTVQREKRGSDAPIKALDACGTGLQDEWGCNKVVDRAGIDYRGKDTDAEPYSWKELGVKDPEIDQILSCA